MIRLVRQTTIAAVLFMAASSRAEITATGTTVRRRGSIGVRRATHRHRVCLPRDAHGHETPCLTIIVTGPHIREWGFWCPHTSRQPERFIPWRDITAGGCGEHDAEQPS